MNFPLKTNKSVDLYLGMFVLSLSKLFNPHHIRRGDMSYAEKIDSSIDVKIKIKQLDAGKEKVCFQKRNHVNR